MSKKNVFSRPEANESHSRNAFDRSFVTNFNLSAGMLIPSFCKFCFGKSHIRINQSSFFRTADINTPAFPSMPMYTDYYFVPMHQLLSNWNAFRSQTNDRASSSIPVASHLPYFNVSDLRNQVDAAYNAGTNDGAGYDWIEGALRLTDMLGLGITSDQWTGIENSALFTPFGSVHPFFFAAYQKVYYDHYRNTAYEANDVRAYNFDRYYVNMGNDIDSPGQFVYQDLQSLLTLRYANYRRDFFNTVYPSLNFVSTNALAFNNRYRLPSNVVGIGRMTSSGAFAPASYPSMLPVVDSMGASPSGTINVAPTQQYQQGFTLQNLRAAFALEKLARVAAFAPQHVVDQFEARFGYRPRSESMHESVRLGSFKCDIIAGEVTQTASTDTTSSGGTTQINRLDQVGGKGVGASDRSKPISYDVPEDGIIIGLTYVLPRMTYDSYCVDQTLNQLYPEDWSLPEFENLGLQPILCKHMQTYKNDASEQDSIVLARQNGVLGYQPRDMQYKASVSQNHGLFNHPIHGTSGFLNDFVFHGNLTWMDTIALGAVIGLNASFFKCHPSDLDSIFAQQYDGTQKTDQFFGCQSVDFACIQDKPIFGVPRL